MSFLGSLVQSYTEADRLADTAVKRRHHPDYQILLYMGLLMMLGLVVIYAIGPQRANALQLTNINFFLNQSRSLFAAIIAFIVFAKVPYPLIRKHAREIVLIGFISLFILAVAGLLKLPIAQCSLGACRWFNIPSLGSIQPAEFMKFGVLVFGAAFLGSRASKGLINNFEKTIVPFGIIMGVAALFIVGLQKDMGTGLSLAAIAATMFVIAGLNARTGIILFAAALAFAVLFIIVAPHRIERVVTFFGHDKSAAADEDTGYHIKNAKIAIGTGGLFGVGIGNSIQATGYLPEAVNDSVFAIMGEMFGFVGLTIILALFAALLLRIITMVDHLADPWMKLVAAGVFGWLAGHVFLNVAAMVGLVPLTGITLPLLSFGGTSMIFIAGALGLVFQLSRYTTHDVVELKEGQNENSSSRRRIRRTRYASSRSFTRA